MEDKTYKDLAFLLNASAASRQQFVSGYMKAQKDQTVSGHTVI
jgi:hypothetical protein